MLYSAAALLVLLAHLAFVAFVVFGACLVPRWPRLVWVHLPAAAWGVYVEAVGRGCPLTLLENLLRARAGLEGYAEGFVEHYIVALLYPAGLTHGTQYVLAGLVIVINLALYAWVWKRQGKTPLHRK